MNCHDFESSWNARLDSRGATPGVSEPTLEAHAASCPSCQAIQRRYQVLNQAIAALSLPPSPPAGFADRVLAAADAEVLRLPTPAWRKLTPIAAAAAVFFAATLGLWAWRADRGEGQPEPVARVRSIDRGDLSEALALATSATWDLAREASAPAARVGQQVLGSAEIPERPSAISLPVGVTIGPAADALQSVGDRVNAGVGPLEGTARHAFGFLLGGPSPGKPGA